MPKIDLGLTSYAGRGVFAAEDIPARTLVTTTPVLLLTEADLCYDQPSTLDNYVFTWPDTQRPHALALGWGSLFNHSSTPTLTYHRNVNKMSIEYSTTRHVTLGEELTIFYGFGQDRTYSGKPISVEDRSSDETEQGFVSKLSGISLDDGCESVSSFSLDDMDSTEYELQAVTTEVPLVQRPLTTVQVFAVKIDEARHSRRVFNFIRKQSVAETINNMPNCPSLSHLKRVKRIITAPIIAHGDRQAPTACKVIICSVPVTDMSLSMNGYDKTEINSQNRSNGVSGTLSPIPTIDEKFQADLQAELDADEYLGLSGLKLKIYRDYAPAHPAYSRKQHQEWSQIWPVAFVPPRAGKERQHADEPTEEEDEIEIIASLGGHKSRKAWKDWVVYHLYEVSKTANAIKSKNQEEYPIACRVVRRTAEEKEDPMGEVVAEAMDTRCSSGDILQHAVMNLAEKVGDIQHQTRDRLRSEEYLFTGYHVFMTHEPCVMCSMALVHSRVASAYYVRESKDAGGLQAENVPGGKGIHELGGLNHKFRVWQLHKAQKDEKHSDRNIHALTEDLAMDI